MPAMATTRNKALIIDDNEDFVELLGKQLELHGLEVLSAGSAEEGIRLAREARPDIALVDVRLPDRDGVSLVGALREENPELPIIMVSGLGDPQHVVAAMQAGAVDYVQKPIDGAVLLRKIDDAMEVFRDISIEKELTGGGLILGTSMQVQRLIRDISKVASARAPVLLLGESGTGKTLVAETIHAHSGRRSRPFVTISCPSIPEHLLESELFGHERGAFTGAVQGKEGKFELADGGTIFLDEIGDLPLELQVKILRVLQNHEFERVGGLKTIRVDVRIIAATNRNLEEAMRARRFREDLYYRLNVLPLYLPALRDRRGDIPQLAEAFLRTSCRKANKRFEKISDEILARMAAYDWPGNIRELQNVIERAVVLGREPTLQPEDIVLGPAGELPAGPVGSVADIENRALVRALETSGGNISRAARLLGVGRDTVYRRLRKYGIGVKRSGER